MKAFQVMLISSFVFIIIGIYGYISSGSATALIAPAIGIILFILAFPTKKDNHIAAHIGIGLTALAMIAFFVTGFIRSNILVIIMAVVALVALIFYIMDFKRRKREREAAGL